MKKGLVLAGADEIKANAQLDRFKRINEEVQKLKEKYARWDAKG